MLVARFRVASDQGKQRQACGEETSDYCVPPAHVGNMAQNALLMSGNRSEKPLSLNRGIELWPPNYPSALPI